MVALNRAILVFSTLIKYNLGLPPPPEVPSLPLAAASLPPDDAALRANQLLTVVGLSGMLNIV